MGTLWEEPKPWFLTVMFKLRCFVLPMFGDMRTLPCVVLLLLLTLYMYFLDSHKEFGGYHTVPVWIPWFFAGYLIRRHGIIDAFFRFASKRESCRTTFDLLQPAIGFCTHTQ